MKISLVLALLAPLILPCVAHAQNSDARSEALPMAPKSAATADAFVWRFAPPVGSRWTMLSFKRVISVGPVGADGTPNLGLLGKFANDPQAYKVTAIQRVTADYDVLSRDKFGATTIRLTYRKLLDYLTVHTIGTAVSMSEPPGGENRIDGATITFKQGPDGRIWGVLDTRSFVRRYLQSNGMTDEKLLRKTLASIHVPSNAEVAQYINQAVGNLPDSPVRVGESWKNFVTFPTMSEVKVGGTRTLKALDANFAVVGDSARFEGSDPNQKIPVTTTMGLDYNQLTGTITGTERVERSSGLALETNVTTVLKGRVSARIRGDKNDAKPTQATSVNVTSTLRVVLEPR